MLRILFIVFIVIPLLELYLLIKLGGEIGAFYTILLIILTALAGGVFMKAQGMRVMQDARQSLLQGKMVEQQAFEGVLVFIGGVLLLLPGLVTDAIGLLLLLPPIRKLVAKRWLQNRLASAEKSQSASYVYAEWTVKDPISGKLETRVYETSQDDKIIDGEVIDKK